jgi:hypothetical protein
MFVTALSAPVNHEHRNSTAVVSLCNWAPHHQAVWAQLYLTRSLDSDGKQCVSSSCSYVVPPPPPPPKTRFLCSVDTPDGSQVVWIMSGSKVSCRSTWNDVWHRSGPRRFGEKPQEGGACRLADTTFIVRTQCSRNVWDTHTQFISFYGHVSICFVFRWYKCSSDKHVLMEDILWQDVVAGERPAVTVKVTRISGTVRMEAVDCCKTLESAHATCLCPIAVCCF